MTGQGSEARVPTVGVIAERLGVGVHRVQYVIRSRWIRPVGRAGSARVFSEEQIRWITSELRRVARARGEHDGIGGRP